MKTKFVVMHRLDTNNVGDMASNPLQYFLKPDEYQVVDVANQGKVGYPSELPMIIGGGGLLGNDFIGDFLRTLFESADVAQLERMWEETWSLSNPQHLQVYNEFNEKYQTLIRDTIDKIDTKIGPRFIWGAGHNASYEAEYGDIRWPKLLSKCKVVGIRDYVENSRFPWTPCASCMHPALNKKYTIKNDIIFFEHKKQLIKPQDFSHESIPRFVNSGSNIDQTIELLGSANYILTNSYHGAYWGTLLKKKVVVIYPWSSKFKWLKHAPAIVQTKKDNWLDALDQAKIYDNALEESITATKNFWSQIKVWGAA